MTHNTQALIASERERWLKLRLERGMAIEELKARSGFSRDTLHRWKREYLKHDLYSLKEKSRAHHSHPRTTKEDIVKLVRKLRVQTAKPRGAKKIALRLKKKYGVVLRWRVAHAILKREKLVSKTKRIPNKITWIPKTTFPGELIQMDVIYVRKHRGRWLYQFTAIDCCTRWRFLWMTPEQSNRATMEAADILYGVTLNPDGTSKILSIKLETEK